MLVVCILASALGALVMCLLVLRYGFTPVSDTEPERADHQLLVTRLGHATAGVCFVATAILATVVLAKTPAQPVDTFVGESDPRVTERLAALERERQALREQITALGGTVQALREQVGAVGDSVQGQRARLDRTDGRVARVEAGLKRLGDEVAQAGVRGKQVERPIATRPALAPVREPVVHPASRPPVRRAPAPEPPPESASPPAAETVLPGPVTRAAPSPAAVAAAPKPAPAAEPAPQPSRLGDKMRQDWDTIRKGFASAGDEIVSAVRGVGRRVRGD